MESESSLDQFVTLALDCIHRPYPHALVEIVHSESDVRDPLAVHPAFYGCFDWHSAVHSHWTLVRAIRWNPTAPWAGRARAALSQNLSEATLAAEADYLRTPGREGFERPYGLAWLLQLAAELRQFEEDEDARNWRDWLEPLESIAAERLAAWLPKLSYPIRCGQHSQTAFAMSLAIDWARTSGDSAFERLVISRSRDFYATDRDAPLQYEPSAFDFLSPSLAEADLMRRVMPRDEFSSWLREFLPQIPTDGSSGWLLPVQSSDPADGKLSHLNGLNLSRAWMLQGIESALAESDPRRISLSETSILHTQTGLRAIWADHYAGAHWLGSFALYLLTRRGLR